MQPFIELKNVGIHFSNEAVLSNVNFTVSNSDFVSIIGKSGTGKTTLIQMIAGLLAPTSGEVLIDGKIVDRPREEMTYVFQKPVMLEWRTILENLLLPMELQGKVGTKDKNRARDLLKLVNLDKDEHKFPHECSGGMLSRAALARALFTNPQIMLMDEPFAALDWMTKEQLQLELAKIINSYRPTIVFITHDIQEAVFLSNRIILIGEKPATVVEEFLVPFKGPRTKELKYQSEFTQLVKEIHDVLDRMNT